MRCVVKHMSIKPISQVIKFFGAALITYPDVTTNAYDKRNLSVFEKLDDISRGQTLDQRRVIRTSLISSHVLTENWD